MFRVSRIYAGQAADYLTEVLNLQMRGPGFFLDEMHPLSPARWCGGGLGWFGVAGSVTARQLENLFVDGLHPDADRLYGKYLELAAHPLDWSAARAARASAATVRSAARSVQLGARWAVYSGVNPWRQAMYRAYSVHNLELGVAKGAPIAASVRTELHQRVGREEFSRLHGRLPADGEELRRFLRTYRRPAQGAVSGYELVFTAARADGVLSELCSRHDLAVAAAVSVVESRVAVSRLRVSGKLFIEPVEGLVMAVFPAEAVAGAVTSRVLLSSKVRTDDGRWVSLDGGALYRAVPEITSTYAQQGSSGSESPPS